MQLASGGMAAPPPASPRSALGTITNSPRGEVEVAGPRAKTPRSSPRAKTPRESPSMSPRQVAMAAQRPSFPYLRRQQDSTVAQDPDAECKHTPSKEHLGSLLASLRVDHPQLGVKKLKVKVQEREPSWKVGCKEIRRGLVSTPVREALNEYKPSVEKSMLEASFRTSSLDLSNSLGRDEAVMTSPERSKSEGSLVDIMRASLVFDSSCSQPRLGLPSNGLSLVERMKASAVTSADARNEDTGLHPSDANVHAGLLSNQAEIMVAGNAAAKKWQTHREELAPPPPPPRDSGPPPPLPPRDHVVAAVSALKLGLRWKARAMQAAAERASNDKPMDVKACVESHEEAGPVDDEIDAHATDEDDDTMLSSAVRERLVPPPPPPRDSGPPPPLPPRDHVVAAVSALKLGLRWKARAMQAAAERASNDKPMDVKACVESHEEAGPVDDEIDAHATDEDEDMQLDTATEERRRAFLETASSAVLASPVLHNHYVEAHEPSEDDILASPTVEARSRRSAFLRQELTDNALLRSAEKFITARTLSSLEEMQMSPLRTLSWSDDAAERTESSSGSSSSGNSTNDSDVSEGSDVMSFEQLTAKLLSAAQVAPSAESRSYLTQLYTTMTGLADEKNRQAQQLQHAQARADESEAKLRELQTWVQSLATRTSVCSPRSCASSDSELPTPAPHISSIAASATGARTGNTVRPRQRQQARRKRGVVSCGCGSRPIESSPVLLPVSQTTTSHKNVCRSINTATTTVQSGAAWRSGIFAKYSEDPSVSQRIVQPIDGSDQPSADRRRLASAAVADLVEIVYLPRLERLFHNPLSYASESLVSLLPRSSWNEDGPEWAALTARFGIGSFGSGFTREQYFAWDMQLAHECASCAATGAGPATAVCSEPKRRWGRRKSRSTAAAETPIKPFAPQYMQQHYNALEAGGEHQYATTPISMESDESLPLPRMPTVSVDAPATGLQDEATQDAVNQLERVVGDSLRL